jgi:hypothetical protein
MEGVAGPAEVTVPADASEGAVLAGFQGKDPDVGTVFTYRIIEGNGDEAFALDPRTGILTLRKKGRHPARTLTVEAQDNCIPLSIARSVCKIAVP